MSKVLYAVSKTSNCWLLCKAITNNDVIFVLINYKGRQSNQETADRFQSCLSSYFLSKI